MIDDTNVEALKTYVDQAEAARDDEDFALVDETYNTWLGPTGIQSHELRELVSDTPSFNHESDSRATITPTELFAVGLLGLQRIELVSATKEFKDNPDFSKLRLESIVERYKRMFALLNFTARFPYTIHGGIIDWLGEYYQDLVSYSVAIGNAKLADELLQKAFSELEAKMQTLSQPEQQAATLSSIGLLHLRKGRLHKSVESMLTGGKIIEQSHQLSPNPQRKKDVGNILLKESVDNVFSANPLETIKVAMLGAKLRFQK